MTYFVVVAHPPPPGNSFACCQEHLIQAGQSFLSFPYRQSSISKQWQDLLDQLQKRQHSLNTMQEILGLLRDIDAITEELKELQVLIPLQLHTTDTVTSVCPWKKKTVFQGLLWTTILTFWYQHKIIIYRKYTIFTWVSNCEFHHCWYLHEKKQSLLQGLSLIRKPDMVLLGVHYRFKLCSKIKMVHLSPKFRSLKVKVGKKIASCFHSS